MSHLNRCHVIFFYTMLSFLLRVNIVITQVQITIAQIIYIYIYSSLIVWMFHLRYNINNYQHHERERKKNKEKLHFLVVLLVEVLINMQIATFHLWNGGEKY